MKWALFDASVYLACALALGLGFVLRPVLRAFRHAPPLSLWSGTPIINMATNARAERLLGVDARSLVFETYFITREFDYDLSRWRRIPAIGPLIPLAVLIWASVMANRLHFYCDRGFLPSRGHLAFDVRELVVYRALGIPVLLWTYGADIRSRNACRSMGEPNCCTHCDAPGRYCVCDDGAASRNHARLRRWSTAIFAGIGDMFPYTPGSINDTFFWPLDLGAEGGSRYAPSYPSGDGSRRLRIVHASNHRLFKGTDYLIRAVERLKAEGHDMELVLVERIPNAEALALYRSADVIFDQCLMGNYGFFALEAMALGKPVMCFIRNPGQYLLNPAECPLINTHITTLEDDLRRLDRERWRLPELGQQGRRYIERNFSMQAFAARLARAYGRLGLPAHDAAATSLVGHP